MGVHFPSVSTNTFIGPLPANANEAVLLTTPPLNPTLDNAQVILHWFADVIAGTNTTVFVYRIRRGTTAAGAVVGGGTWSATVTAGNAIMLAGTYIDSPGIVAGQQYSLTLSMTGATVAGTFQDGALLAYVL